MVRGVILLINMGKMGADNSLLYKLWENNYKGIGNCNLALDEVATSPVITEEKRVQSIGELRFIRAFMYFDLVQQFGRIPLVLKGSYEVQTAFKRASVGEVYDAIISDLRYGVENLPIPDKVSDVKKGKANSYVAAHLLSKVYLTRASASVEDRGKKQLIWIALCTIRKKSSKKVLINCKRTFQICGR